LNNNEGNRESLMAYIEIATEHWWRVRVLDVGGPAYEPDIAATLKRNHITLPFTIEGSFL
jgi:hypothetical protein